MTDNTLGPPPSQPGGDTSEIREPGGGIYDAMASSLSRTQPWALLIAVLGLLIGAFTLFVGFANILGSGSLDNNAALRFGFGALIILLGAIFLLPSYKIWCFAQSINHISVDPVTGVEDAVEHQRSFWKTVGVMAIFIALFFGGVLFSTFIFSLQVLKDLPY